MRSVMLDAVLMPDAAARHELRFFFRRLGVDQPDLARLVVVDVDQNELFRLR
jgi:hypothetical protein